MGSQLYGITALMELYGIAELNIPLFIIGKLLVVNCE